MSSLKSILAAYRAKSQTEREKGSYFEELIRAYFRYEATYADLYSAVWLYADWAKAHGFSAKDTGTDLVAKTHGTEEFHAIQCKCYAADYRVRKADIDSFFTASNPPTAASSSWPAAPARPSPASRSPRKSPTRTSASSSPA